MFKILIEIVWPVAFLFSLGFMSATFIAWAIDFKEKRTRRFQR